MIEIHGYAIVSRDDRIAEADGSMPAALRNGADWAYFQAELDRADLVVLGRHGHEAHGNRSGRLRMVVSTSADGIEMRGTDWWWNPAQVSWPEAAARVLPDGGRVAVPGGRRVFDLFLGIGFTAFHLSRAERVEIADGVAVFSACGDGRSAEDVLAASGLQPGPSEMIDPEAPVSLTIWR